MKSEEQKELLRFLGILLAVVVVVLGVYFLTKKFVTKEGDETPKEETPAVGNINYDLAIVGNMLNKPESDYYVFIYDDESANKDMYTVLDYLNIYQHESDYEKNRIRVYNVELNDYLNKDFKVKEGEKSNPNAKDVTEFKFGDFTLIRVKWDKKAKENKITKYLEDAEAIKKELGIKDED